jgi:hypothetical protein
LTPLIADHPLSLPLPGAGAVETPAVLIVPPTAPVSTDRAYAGWMAITWPNRSAAVAETCWVCAAATGAAAGATTIVDGRCTTLTVTRLVVVRLLRFAIVTWKV